jgi:glycosyltransferase involved in cell wall biosynthesis
MTPHLVHVFPAFAGGGPEVRTADVINRSANAFRHTILSLNQDVSGQTMLLDTYQIRCLPVRDRALTGLARLLRQLRPDLVLTYGWGGTDAIAAARLSGISRVLHMEDGFLDDEVRRQKLPRQLVRRVLFKAARCLVVPSRTLWAIARQTWKVAERRLRYIPNGIDTDRFQPANATCRRQQRATLGLPADAIVVGTVGALRPEKNQLRLVRAFKQVARDAPRAHLLVVGDGPLRQPMQHELQNQGLSERATFCGRVSDPERFYQAMDVFALPSDTEQMSLALLEAMASGLPVVGTDVGDTKSVVDVLNRPCIVPPNGDDSFADALQTMLADDQLRTRLSTANRRRALEEYSFDRMLRDYVALYEEHLAT